MLRSLGASLLLVLFLAVFGCAAKAHTAQRPLGIAAGTWAGEANGASVTLSLSSDGRFQTVFNGGKFRAVVKGKAKIEASTLVLEATELDGEPAQAKQTPAKFIFTPEWTTLTAENGLTLSRKI